MFRLVVVVLVLTLFATVPLRAQEKPAEKPKSPDETALRDTLKSLAKALQEGDAAGIRKVIHAADDTEKKMVDAMADMASQIAKLHKSAVKAFGDEQAKALTGDVVAEMTRIDEAEIAIEGDSATVRYPTPPAEPTTRPANTESSDDDDAPASAPAPMVMKKIDGAWRVPMAELAKGSTPEDVEQRLADLKTQSEIVAELADEIAKGEYKSAEKAADAWQAKMMQAITARVKKAPEQVKPEPEKSK